MKQKFTFIIDEKKENITLQEAGEADPGAFISVHEERYPYEDIKNALEGGQDLFIEILRRKNLFPPFDLSVKIFETLKAFLTEGHGDKLVIEYEDIEAFPKENEEVDEVDDADVDELESLLKDETEDLTEDDIKEIDGDDDTPKFQLDNNSEHEN
ncbi:hypothetical protein [Desulfocicer niacini]